MESVKIPQIRLVQMKKFGTFDLPPPTQKYAKEKLNHQILLKEYGKNINERVLSLF